MNPSHEWLQAELEAAAEVGQINWRSLVNHVILRDNLQTATGPASAAFHVNSDWETWLHFHDGIYSYAPLFRQKLLLHELYHATQYENLVSFFKNDKQAALAFHNAMCQQQSGFAILYARNEVEAEAFAIYALINHYGRQTISIWG